MRTSILCLSALAAVACALCDNPVSASVSFLISQPPTALNVSELVKNSESLIYSHSQNGVLLASWNHSSSAPMPEIDGCTIESYTHALAASPYCNNSATLLKWDAAACVQGSREVAQGWLTQLISYGGSKLVEQYGGKSLSGDAQCDGLAGSKEPDVAAVNVNSTEVLPSGMGGGTVMPSGAAASGISTVTANATATEVVATGAAGLTSTVMTMHPTGINGLPVMPTNSVGGNATNGTLPPWAQPSQVSGAVAEDAKLGMAGLVIGLAIGVILL